MRTIETLPRYDSNNLSKTYAGIGSRETPPEILSVMTDIAVWLEKQQYKLQTGISFYGREEGADLAFSREITNVEKFDPESIVENSREWEIVRELHPAFSRLKPGGIKLQARNARQILGANLDRPVDFVLFWAKERHGSNRPNGGTGQAVELARILNIPTVNFWNNPDYKRQILWLTGYKPE